MIFRKEKNNDTPILFRFNEGSKQRGRAGEAKVVNSRYSIVMATSKRARQIIGGEEAFVESQGRKPLSVAIDELNRGKIKIVGDEEEE